ncbi:MAG: hypothetical protein NTZ44_01525 [Candidatus Nomurabacteria bacterium]|nr:hypothetical protein [Candidatus Nomurabacteria bacterium]
MKNHKLVEDPALIRQLYGWAIESLKKDGSEYHPGIAKSFITFLQLFHIQMVKDFINKDPGRSEFLKEQNLKLEDVPDFTGLGFVTIDGTTYVPKKNSKNKKSRSKTVEEKFPGIENQILETVEEEPQSDISRAIETLLTNGFKIISSIEEQKILTHGIFIQINPSLINGLEKEEILKLLGESQNGE